MFPKDHGRYTVYHPIKYGLAENNTILDGLYKGINS